jgi:hypothetical protein
MCTILFVVAIAGGALLWRSSDMKFDTSGPGTLDENYTVVTKDSVTSYDVSYTFTAKGKQFTGKDNISLEPTTADTTVYYMSADPADNSLRETTSNKTRMWATGGAFLAALIAFILLPKNYLMKVFVSSSAPGIGDAQGEPSTMKHGKYHAWTYVYIAFVLQIAVVGVLFDLAVSMIAKSPMLSYLPLGIASAVAAFIALWVYSDRYRCIEAFTSRSCSGVMNLSLLYVPFIALVYANVRGLRKFAGK